jgi:hypothetical protein
MKNTIRTISLKDRKLFIDCTNCNNWLNFTLPAKLVKNRVKLKCSHCSNIEEVALNTRKHLRKETVIYGDIIINDKKIPATITDISVGGVAAKVRNTSLKIGDVIKVKYELPDKAHTEIEEDLEIIRLTDDKFSVTIGCKCIDDTEYTTTYKRKGFFIMDIDTPPLEK